MKIENITIPFVLSQIAYVVTFALVVFHGDEMMRAMLAIYVYVGVVIFGLDLLLGKKRSERKSLYSENKFHFSCFVLLLHCLLFAKLGLPELAAAYYFLGITGIGGRSDING
ncbi:hypothetical protein [Rodentibacter caecimuris]|uniref:hypothetical protein n=1 Tax=Rodentibacter caecimuris TaxID=1796644 RepID=UPI00224901BD|nr:hypothetical protein [Rodentibacter heylii]MCX2960322.1 hypothetical protein [Rodentibacter heylii]